jgi:hypothetical protein
MTENTHQRSGAICMIRNDRFRKDGREHGETLACGRTPMRRLRSRRRTYPDVGRGRRRDCDFNRGARRSTRTGPVWRGRWSLQARPPRRPCTWKRAQSSSTAVTPITRTTSGGPARSACTVFTISMWEPWWRLGCGVRANGSWMRITFPRRRPVLVIETDRLASRFHLESITLINDLEAATFGLAALEPEDSLAVHAGSPDAMLQPRLDPDVAVAGSQKTRTHQSWDFSSLRISNACAASGSRVQPLVTTGYFKTGAPGCQWPKPVNLHGVRPSEVSGGGGDLPRDLGMMSGRTWRCVLGAPGFGREHARKSDPM